MTLLASAPGSITISPDDILKMDGLFELVDGQLVEKQMSFLSGETSVEVSFLLRAFLKGNPLGKLVSEVTFKCFPNNENQILRPDLAFITSARLSVVPEEGHVPIRPDLAIEIVSPSDSVYELDDKLIDYRTAGIPLIWIINPHARNVKIFRPKEPIEELSGADVLSGDDVLPGFSAPVSAMFSTTVAKG